MKIIVKTNNTLEMNITIVAAISRTTTATSVANVIGATIVMGLIATTGVANATGEAPMTSDLATKVDSMTSSSTPGAIPLPRRTTFLPFLRAALRAAVGVVLDRLQPAMLVTLAGRLSATTRRRVSRGAMSDSPLEEGLGAECRMERQAGGEAGRVAVAAGKAVVRPESPSAL